MKNFLHRIFHSIIAQFLLIALLFFGYHLVCPLIIEHYNIDLKGGALSSKTVVAPLYAWVDVHFDWWVIFPLVVLVVYMLVFRSILTERNPIPLPILLVLAMALKVGIDVSVALINGGLPALARESLQFYPDVPKIEGVRALLRNYVHLAPTLSTSSGTHPPGGTFFMWTVARLFSYDLPTASFSIILFSSLSIIPMYLLAEQFHGRKVGYYTLALYLITPNLVLLTATGMDGVFTVFPIWSVYLFYKSLEKKSVILSILTGISLGVSMFFNFTTTFIGVFFIAAVILTYFNNRQKFRNYLTMLLISGGIFCVFYILLYFLFGYNFLACLRGAILIDDKGSLHHAGMGTGYETVSRYLYISISNLFAFFIFISVPITTLWVRELVKVVRNAKKKIMEEQNFDNYLLAYVITLVCNAFATLYSLETERVWMFMAPFILIPAAKHLAEYIEKKRNLRMFYGVAALLCIQILAFEIFLNTWS